MINFSYFSWTGYTEKGRLDALSQSKTFNVLLFWQGTGSFPLCTIIDDAVHQTTDFISNPGFVFASRDQDKIQEEQKLPRGTGDKRTRLSV